MTSVPALRGPDLSTYAVYLTLPVRKEKHVRHVSQLNLNLRLSTGECALSRSIVPTSLRPIFRSHLEKGSDWVHWVIAYAPGRIPVKELTARFAPGGAAHELLTAVLTARHRSPSQLHAVAAAADRVTEHFLEEPLIRRSRRRAEYLALPPKDPYQVGEYTYPARVHVHYAMATAMVTGVQPVNSEIPDLRILAAFLGTEMSPWVSTALPEVVRLPDVEVRE